MISIWAMCSPEKYRHPAKKELRVLRPLATPAVLQFLISIVKDIKMYRNFPWRVLEIRSIKKSSNFMRGIWLWGKHKISKRKTWCFCNSMIHPEKLLKMKTKFPRGKSRWQERAPWRILSYSRRSLAHSWENMWITKSHLFQDYLSLELRSVERRRRKNSLSPNLGQNL